MNKDENYLKSFEIYIPKSSSLGEGLFKIILLIILTLFISGGLYLQTIEPIPQKIVKNIKKFKTQFVIQENKTPPEKKKKVKKKILTKKSEKPVDLTKKPELNKKVEDTPKPVPEKKKVRRIYGLKRVYSKGIGSRGSLHNAVIGKFGNTINKEVDTLTAEKDEIKGEIVSTTTVTTAPRFKRKVKPEYSKEMIENKVEGVIKVKALVDVDGRIKKAKALNDIGFSARNLALNACFNMLFEPAMRGAEPVAVWIIIPIRFQLLDS